MSGNVESRLAELGIQLPSPVAPAANYLPTVLSGKLLHVSGQLPTGADGLAYRGKLGEDFDTPTGREAARLCAINVLAQARAALGDLDLVARVVKLGGWVNCTPDFSEQPVVMNGASDLMVEVFAERGRHARFAVGAPALPFGAAVEVEALFEIA